MNTQFDELTKGLAKSVTRRGALKQFGIGLAGLALAFTSLSPFAIQAQTAVPFRASWESQISIAPLAPPLFSVTGLGTGKALHLGAMTAESTSEVVNLATGDGAASYRFTAANGDDVLLTFVFLAIPTSPTAFSIEGVWLVTGGTGRFEGASGSGTYVGQAKFVGPADAVGTFALEGTISSPKRP